MLRVRTTTLEVRWQRFAEWATTKVPAEGLVGLQQDGFVLIG